MPPPQATVEEASSSSPSSPPVSSIMTTPTENQARTSATRSTTTSGNPVTPVATSVATTVSPALESQAWLQDDKQDIPRINETLIHSLNAHRPHHKPPFNCDLIKNILVRMFDYAEELHDNGFGKERSVSLCQRYILTAQLLRRFVDWGWECLYSDSLRSNIIFETKGVLDELSSLNLAANTLRRYLADDMAAPMTTKASFIVVLMEKFDKLGVVDAVYTMRARELREEVTKVGCPQKGTTSGRR